MSNRSDLDGVQVAVNCAIRARGISGSAQGLNHLLTALSQHPFHVRELDPTRRLRTSHLWNAWTQTSWDMYGADKASADADLLLSPVNAGATWRGRPHLLVIHDTMVLDTPELFDPGYVAVARMVFGISASRADVILVPSKYARDSVRRRWPKTKQIVVAEWPTRVVPRPSRTAPEVKSVIMVGATEPHKRHTIGIDACAAARRVGVNVRLTLIGPAGRAEPEVRRRLAEVDAKGQWTDRVVDAPHETLRKTYAAAWVLLQPSASEGYGLPVVEAAGLGVPVIHSGAGAMRELVPTPLSESQSASPAAYADAMVALTSEEAYGQLVATSIRSVTRLSMDAFRESVYQAIYMALA